MAYNYIYIVDFLILSLFFVRCYGRRGARKPVPGSIGRLYTAGPLTTTVMTNSLKQQPVN